MQRTLLALLALVCLASSIGCGPKEPEPNTAAGPQTLTPPPNKGGDATGQTGASSATPTSAPAPGLNPNFSGDGGIGSKAGK